MNKLISVILAVIVMSFFGGCSRILSPEELINPPELNVEKKEVKDAITKFLPQNSELFPFPYAKENRESSFSLRDIDKDGNNEIIAVYRDKATFKIGILVLKNEYGLWVKKEDIKLDGNDVTDYLISDLDKDGMVELVIGYESRNDAVRKLDVFTNTTDGMKQIFETDYYALSIYDVIGDDSNELVIASVAAENNDNRVSVFGKENNEIIRFNSIVYPIGTEPYNLTIGKLEDNRNAIFVDLYVDNSYGKSDVLVYEKNLLYSIVEEGEEGITYQQTPIQSADVDKDGIIEIGNTSVSPMLKDDVAVNSEVIYGEFIGTAMPLRNYYKYIDKSFVKIREYFDEPAIGITLDVPEVLWDKYVVTMVYEDGDNVLTISYSPDKGKAIKNPILEIRLAMKSKKDELAEYQLVSESEDYIVAAKQIVDATGLSGSNYSEYQMAVEATKNVAGIISQFTF